MKLYAHDGTLRIPSAASGSPQRSLIFEAFLEMIINMVIDLKKDIRSFDLILKGRRTAGTRRHLVRENCPTVSCIRPGKRRNCILQTLSFSLLTRKSLWNRLSI